MLRRCSTCGIKYPGTWETSTCRNCGGLIENYDSVPTRLNPKSIEIENKWHDWRNKMFSAPPRPLREEDWIQICAMFNGCVICGSEDIDEKLLVVPPYLGGKLYTYNVIPACASCADKIRRSQLSNPLKPFYTLDSLDKSRLNRCFNYLEALMLDVPFEEFNWEEDSVEIVVTVKEDTSIEPFKGIKVQRIYDEHPKVQKMGRPLNVPVTHYEETYGVTWRLL